MKKNVESHYEDLNLIERTLQKDQQALETLYNKYNGRLASFIRAFSVSNDDTPDIIQTTFISALNSLNGFRGNSQFFTWICSIARRKIADYYRVRQKRPESWEDLMERGKLGRMAVEQTNSIEDGLIEREFSDKVHDIIKMMPEHYQNILVQKYLLNKTVKDFAAQHGISEKAAESLNTRAKKYFKRLLEENGYFSGGEFFE